MCPCCPSLHIYICIHAYLQSLYKQMVDIIRALGVEAVPTTGGAFDPMIHDAIMREPSSEHPDGTVLMEFRKGFRLKDKLLRPAMVKVRAPARGYYDHQIMITSPSLERALDVCGMRCLMYAMR